MLIHDLYPAIYSIHWRGKVVRMTALVFTGDVEDKLQSLQWITWLSPWRTFRFCVLQSPLLTQFYNFTWRRHPMEAFSASLAFCAGNSSITGEFPSQRPVTRSCDGFFDLRLSKRLNKQSKRRWFETSSRSIWPHCNAIIKSDTTAVMRKCIAYHIYGLNPTLCSRW